MSYLLNNSLKYYSQPILKLWTICGASNFSNFVKLSIFFPDCFQEKVFILVFSKSGVKAYIRNMPSQGKGEGPKPSSIIIEPTIMTNDHIRTIVHALFTAVELYRAGRQGQRRLFGATECDLTGLWFELSIQSNRFYSKVSLTKKFTSGFVKYNAESPKKDSKGYDCK